MYPLNETDVSALAEDIKTNGQIAPIKMLKDGRIIDGRNRWMACQKAGVEPLIDVINPDGEEVTDERLFALATSCNSMRRDLTTSERAVASAVAWKRLFPEQGHGGDRKSNKNQSPKMDFEIFASQSFTSPSGIGCSRVALMLLSPRVSWTLVASVLFTTFATTCCIRMANFANDKDTSNIKVC